MTNMLFDIWVYVGIFGIIGTTAAFPVLLRRYRAAAELEIIGETREFEDIEAGDGINAEEQEEPIAPVPVLADDAQPPEEEIERPVEKKEAPLPSSLKTGQTMVGGISPAVVYLQNLKAQMEHFEAEIHSLRSQVVGFAHKHDQEFELLLKKMTEFQSELHHEMGQHAQPVKPAAAQPPKPAAAQPPKPAAAQPPKPAAAQPPKPAAAQPPKPAAAQPPKPAAAQPPKPAAAQPPKPAAAQPPKPAAAQPPKPAAAQPPKSAAAQEAKLELSEPKLELSPEPEKTPSSAQKVADSLTLNVPESGQKRPNEDPLRPDSTKGPIWPV